MEIVLSRDVTYTHRDKDFDKSMEEVSLILNCCTSISRVKMLAYNPTSHSKCEWGSVSLAKGNYHKFPNNIKFKDVIS